MSQTISGRLAYADLLRCTAMLAVIVVHITGGALEASPVGTPDFMVLNVYDGLTHWCVPVFVMLSGMFLLDPKHSLPPPSFFSAICCVSPPPWRYGGRPMRWWNGYRCTA